MLYRNGKEIEQIFRNGREIALLYKNGVIIYDKRKKEPVDVTVQDLIDQGYARVVTGTAGNYIEILDTCPYEMAHVTDLNEVALNQKQLTEGKNNIIVWDQSLPTGWSQEEVAAIYNNVELSFNPRSEMFWAIGAIDNFSVSFAGGSYATNDYPWGSGNPDGVFAPRYRANSEGEYSSKGFRNTPVNLTVSIRGDYSSVAQVMFTQMKTTKNLTLNCGGIFNCHDVTGMFENCISLENLTITGSFRWDTIRTCHNMFDHCSKLTSIPYVTGCGRDSGYNTIYPHAESPYRGSAACGGLFNATSLESIGPVINMSVISVNGCTSTETYWDDIQNQMITGPVNQSGLSYDGKPIFNCPVLTDVRIINLNNNDWDFTDQNGYVYIPNMDVASAEYLLNNVADVTEQGGHTVTLPQNGTISADAIANAESKGWTVQLVTRK